jgi:hypothetical protein
MAVSLTPSISIGQRIEPLVKQGACPSGYRTQGDYCVPGSAASAS